MPAPAPEPEAPDAPIPRLLRVTALIAAIGVVVALVGAGLFLRPIQTPTQDCGTVAAFLLQGRSDAPADPDHHPTKPCSERVADAVGPGAVLVGAGVVAALGALMVEVVARNLARRRRNRAHQAAAAG